jgi:hypothetical protein
MCSAAPGSLTLAVWEAALGGFLRAMNCPLSSRSLKM